MMIERLPHEDNLHRPVEPLNPVPGREVWRMVVPWLGHLFLAAAALLGLFTASGAPDAASYDAGFALFVLAVVAIAWRLKRQLDGAEVGFLLNVSVDNLDSLFVAIALLVVLALVGIWLAAAIGGPFYPIGIALFIIAAALIFNEIRRYFDHFDAS